MCTWMGVRARVCARTHIHADFGEPYLFRQLGGVFHTPYLGKRGEGLLKKGPEPFSIVL